MIGALVMVMALILSEGGAAETAIAERTEWAAHFKALDARGTIVVADERAGSATLQVFDDARARTRYSPASTFKIPHTLFALDAGAVRDEFEIVRWDGVEHSFAPHNGDQDLRSAMRNSAVWVYRGFARVIGTDQAGQYLEALNYGNADPRAARGDYWIDGNLAISAYEQIAFLQALYRNQLPFPLAHQRLVKDLIVVEAGRDWILRAKSGWDGNIGWWIGWIEWPEGPVFFALNIDTPNRMADIPKREAIVRSVLRTLDALAPSGDAP